MDRLQEKRLLLEELLKEDYAFVHLHSRIPGLSLPLDIMQAEVVTLKLSHNFTGKMNLSSDCIEAELRFGSRTHHCKIPWTAVWGMSAIDDRRFVWPDEVPNALALPEERKLNEASTIAPPDTKSEKPSQLVEQPRSDTQVKRPTLRRVK